MAQNNTLASQLSGIRNQVRQAQTLEELFDGSEGEQEEELKVADTVSEIELGSNVVSIHTVHGTHSPKKSNVIPTQMYSMDIDTYTNLLLETVPASKPVVNTVINPLTQVSNVSLQMMQIIELLKEAGNKEPAVVVPAPYELVFEKAARTSPVDWAISLLLGAMAFAGVLIMGQSLVNWDEGATFRL